MICYALVLVEFSLAEMFARGFDSFSGMVRHAEFDRGAGTAAKRSPSGAWKQI